MRWRRYCAVYQQGHIFELSVGVHYFSHHDFYFDYETGYDADVLVVLRFGCCYALAGVRHDHYPYEHERQS
jgi:hypothetical protein